MSYKQNSLRISSWWGASGKVALILAVTTWSLTLGHSPLQKKKKISNSTKSNCIFHWKLRGDSALIMIYSESPIANFFPYNIHICLIMAIVRGYQVFKVRPRLQTLGRLVSMTFRIFLNSLGGSCLPMTVK